MTVARPIPRLRGEEQIYFDEAKAGRLTFQRCLDCSAAIFYLRSACPTCLAERLELVAASGRGTIHSFTTLHIAGNKAFAEEVPYTVILVDLEEGVRVLADLDGVEPEDVAVGMNVEVFFEDVNDEFTVPRFRRAEGAA